MAKEWRKEASKFWEGKKDPSKELLECWRAVENAGEGVPFMFSKEGIKEDVLTCAP